MLAGNSSLAGIASGLLLFALVAGKVGEDILNSENLLKIPAPDTAIFLIQFVAVIFFAEACRVVLSFDKEAHLIAGKTDDMSHAVRERLEDWLNRQLSRQAQLVAGAVGLSLVLLVVGGLAGVSVNQLAFSAVLVILVVGILIFLVTQRREPDTQYSLR